MVRPANEHDLASIVRIENYAIETGFAHFGTELVTKEAAKAAWEAAEGKHPWLVKELNGDVVAFTRATLWKPRQAYQWTTEVGVYVDPAEQGKGFGKELYGFLFPELEERGFKTIVAGIALPNEASVRLHEAFGMTYVGTFPNMGFKLGEWRSVGYWVKTLVEFP